MAPTPVEQEIKSEQDKLAFGKPTAELEWDGIRKLDMPPPKWWVYVFWATIFWAVAWWVLYPAWPSLRGHTDGILGYDQREVVAGQLAATADNRQQFAARIESVGLDEIYADPELLQYALIGGRVAFGNNCAQCHGLGGAGQELFPSLADDDWLWGGTLDAIVQTVTHGIRNGGDQARDSQMPGFGADQLLTRDQINATAQYVLSLTGRATDAEAAAQGQGVFAENCAACHGETGDGMPETGAPRLNDAIWLYGDDAPAIARQIGTPQHGVMPSFSGRLDPATIKMLAVYVHSLGGGQ
jgi:cytochrome c oxidase cbb3-type subunit 3